MSPKQAIRLLYEGMTTDSARPILRQSRLRSTEACGSKGKFGMSFMTLNLCATFLTVTDPAHMVRPVFGACFNALSGLLWGALWRIQ